MLPRIPHHSSATTQTMANWAPEAQMKLSYLQLTFSRRIQHACCKSRSKFGRRDQVWTELRNAMAGSTSGKQELHGCMSCPNAVLCLKLCTLSVKERFFLFIALCLWHVPRAYIWEFPLFVMGTYGNTSEWYIQKCEVGDEGRVSTCT